MNLKLRFLLLAPGLLLARLLLADATPQAATEPASASLPTLSSASQAQVQSLEGEADRTAYLRELHSAHLFKDLLEMGGLRHPRKLVDLVRLLAFQVGSEVSFPELGTALGLSKDTVANYVDLLEKAFILFRVQGFGRNLRNEVTRNAKFYFCDQGVRNVAIQDFGPFASRSDQGALWENFLVSERRKRLSAKA